MSGLSRVVGPGLRVQLSSWAEVWTYLTAIDLYTGARARCQGLGFAALVFKDNSKERYGRISHVRKSG